MDNLTPSDKVRIQLEKANTQDAISRAKKIKREQSAILPTFLGTDGKVRRLGQGESNALILPNVYYGQGEEMRPIPTGRGGLMAVDNKPLLAEPVIVVASPEPPPPTPTFKTIIFNVFAIGAELSIDGILNVDETALEIFSTGFNLPSFSPNFPSLSQEEREAQWNDLWTEIWADPIDGLPRGYKYESGAVLPPDAFSYSLNMETSPYSISSGTPIETYIAQSSEPYFLNGLEIGCLTDYLVTIGSNQITINGSDIIVGETYELELMLSVSGGAYYTASSGSAIADLFGNIPSVIISTSQVVLTSGDPFMSCSSSGTTTFEYYLRWRKQGLGWFEL